MNEKYAIFHLETPAAGYDGGGYWSIGFIRSGRVHHVVRAHSEKEIQDIWHRCFALV